jgi:hypothetical protein
MSATSDQYRFDGKTLEQLRYDYDQGAITNRHPNAHPTLANMIAINVAIENAKTAAVMRTWTRVAAGASVSSVIVALAAVVVAIVNGGGGS